MWKNKYFEKVFEKAFKGVDKKGDRKCADDGVTFEKCTPRSHQIILFKFKKNELFQRLIVSVCIVITCQAAKIYYSTL